jgi:predicted transglutaminase-like cysteine proteinase
VEAGLPRRALRMTVVIDETGEGHAVLTVRTKQDDLILDINRTDAVLRWQETGYVFVKWESSQIQGWSSLEPETGMQVVGAVK